jgi:hypothetical protein
MPDNIIQTGAVFDGAQFKEGMREAAETVTESCTVMKEQFVQVGEAAQSMSAGFAGIAALAGVGVFGEIINKLKETTLETSHLSEATGISVVHLTELKDAMAAAGVNADRLPMQLTKLSRAMQQAADGQQLMVTAFNRLGISTQGWAEKLPDAMDVLEQMAKHLGNSTNQQRDLAEMSAILGRGTVGLTAFLKDQGVELDKTTGKYVDHGKAVDAAVQSAKELQQAETQLKLAIDTALLPTLSALNETIKAVRIGYEMTAIGVRSFTDAAWTSITTVLRAISGLSTVLDSALSGKFKLAGLQAGVVFDQMGSAFQRMSSRMDEDADKTAKKIAEIMNPKVTKEGGAGPSDDLENKTSKLQGKLDALYLHTRAIGIKAMQDVAKENERSANASLEAWKRENEEKIKEDGKWVKAQEISLEADARHEAAVTALKKQTLDFELQMGHISQKDHDKQLNDMLKSEHNAALESLKIARDLASGDLVVVAQVDAKIKALNDHYRALELTAEQQAALKRAALWKGIANGMGAAFTSFTDGVMSGTETMGQAFSKMVNNMATNFINASERQLAQWLVSLAIKDAADQAENEKAGIRAAVRAARDTFAWASLTHGPVISGLEAAAAFASVMAFGSAEGGQYMVPGPQMTMLHPQEMVLPAGIAGRMRDVIEGGGNGGSGGGHTINVHMNVSAIDSASFKETLGKHAHIVGNAVQNALRKKGIK